MEKYKESNRKKGYVISKGCVKCGVCKVVCPKHCISKGTPYVIHQDRCTRCGLCVKRCRRKLIYLE